MLRFLVGAVLGWFAHLQYGEPITLFFSQMFGQLTGGM